MIDSKKEVEAINVAAMHDLAQFNARLQAALEQAQAELQQVSAERGRLQEQVNMARESYEELRLTVRDLSVQMNRLRARLDISEYVTIATGAARESGEG